MTATLATPDAIIALLVASYGRNVPASSDTVVQAAQPTTKLASVKAAKLAASDGSQAAPTDRKVITTVALPASGTINAREFLIASRRATDRDSKIRNIAAYCGFDNCQDFGSQELAATMKANRELRGAPIPLARPVHSGPAVSLKGYVAGARDESAKRLADLAAREVLAAATLADHLHAAQVAATAEQKHYHASMAQVEQERLQSIQSDLNV